MKTRALIAAFALSAIVLGSGVSAFAYNGYHNYGNHAGTENDEIGRAHV